MLRSGAVTPEEMAEGVSRMQSNSNSYGQLSRKALNAAMQFVEQTPKGKRYNDFRTRSVFHHMTGLHPGQTHDRIGQRLPVDLQQLEGRKADVVNNITENNPGIAAIRQYTQRPLHANISQLRNELDSAQTGLENAQLTHRHALYNEQAAHAEELAKMQRRNTENMVSDYNGHQRELGELQSQHAVDMRQALEDKARSIDELNRNHAGAIQGLGASHGFELEKLKGSRRNWALGAGAGGLALGGALGAGAMAASQPTVAPPPQG